MTMRRLCECEALGFASGFIALELAMFAMVLAKAVSLFKT